MHSEVLNISPGTNQYDSNAGFIGRFENWSDSTTSSEIDFNNVSVFSNVATQNSSDARSSGFIGSMSDKAGLKASDASTVFMAVHIADNQHRELCDGLLSRSCIHNSNVSYYSKCDSPALFIDNVMGCTENNILVNEESRLTEYSTLNQNCRSKCTDSNCGGMCENLWSNSEFSLGGESVALPSVKNYVVTKLKTLDEENMIP